MDGIQTGREGEFVSRSSLWHGLPARENTAKMAVPRRASRIRHRASSFFAASILLLLSLSSGCGNKFFDPTQVGRFRPVPAVNVILDSLGVAEETPVAWEQAQEPLPVDTMAVESDYVFMAGDIISVAIFELLQEDIQFVNNYVVKETGRISIPEVGIIEAAGLTETQLEEKIRQILSPSILKNPSVIVTLAGSQQRSFSILGDGVPLPSRYPIPRYNFRLCDALAMAGGPRQFNVSYIYVSRFVEDKKNTKYEPLKPGFDGFELKVIEPKAAMSSRKIQPRRAGVPPRTQYQWPESKVVIASSEMATDWESAGMPKAFEWPSNRNQSRMDTQTAWKPSTRLTAPGRMDEPVSVKDILNTLEERSRREQKWLNEQVNVENAMESFRELARSEKRTDERINRRNALALSPAPAAPEMMDEPVSVKDVLKTLDERSRNEQQWLNGRVDVENARESFRELARSQKRIDERVDRRDALPSSPAPIAPKRMNEPLAKEEPGRIKWVFQNGKWVPVPVSVPIGSPKPTEEKEQAGHVEWIFRNGRWVPVQVGTPRLPEPIEPVRPVIKIEPGERPAGSFEEPVPPVLEREPGAGTRLIKIPAKKLLAGDPRYNIVIKPGDTIHVPVDIVGEFCIMGNVNRTGFIPITGRQMTLKMAIAAAGGLGPLAWPKRVEVVRRIGRKKEEIVMVDLDKIASGEQPDFFIKPNDFINVGTHPTSRWRAVLRNAFRANYGFGFVYDRNFSYKDYWGTTYNPVLPWKWDSVW
jgi:protein involved in polysaccharide export with SLBB domain